MHQRKVGMEESKARSEQSGPATLGLAGRTEQLKAETLERDGPTIEQKAPSMGSAPPRWPKQRHRWPPGGRRWRWNTKARDRMRLAWGGFSRRRLQGPDRPSRRPSAGGRRP